MAVLHYWLQLSYTITLLIATVMPGLWLVVFHSLMALSSQQATGSSSGSTTLLHTHYREVPTSAAAEGEGQCHSRAFGCQGCKGHFIKHVTQHTSVALT